MEQGGIVTRLSSKLKTMKKVKAKILFTDKTVKKDRQVGQVFEAEPERVKQLIELGFVTEVKEDKAKTKTKELKAEHKTKDI